MTAAGGRKCPVCGRNYSKSMCTIKCAKRGAELCDCCCDDHFDLDCPAGPFCKASAIDTAGVDNERGRLIMEPTSGETCLCLRGAPGSNEDCLVHWPNQ